MAYTILVFNILLITILIYHAVGREVPSACNDVRDQFAVAISEFTWCSINSSRPIKLCENCADYYINIISTYQNMSEVKSVNGTPCLDYFVNLDRLQIVETQYLSSVDLWNRGKCYECYVAANGTQSRERSNEYKQFMNYYESYNSCVTNNHDNPCPNCMDSYDLLQNYFLGISNSNERISFCIDLADLMNSTWTYWGENCCKYRKHHEYIFIGSTIGVIILTIFFYIGVQFCAEKRVPTIIQQTRFAESLSSLRN
ncbi:hypothetical protein NQ318_000842 [Aromia moschata]|uniref:Osteopetrosis-associated transmembrane protein 1 n=1 Tax=Aromia moschata TaxID=1265417 RepID=A0AAV8XAR4_9CUCU|nr:hypothetical protein NQ318_000842 [Aromia moschata]